VPDEFTTERTIGACHSFAKRSTSAGFNSWFHYLCKNIELTENDQGGTSVRNRAAELGYLPAPESPNADYSWQRAGFFLSSRKDEDVTLVCFGVPYRVRARLDEFFSLQAWEDVGSCPYVLFDLVLEGLYFEIETTLQNLTQISGFHEHQNLGLVNGGLKRKAGVHNPFAALHNCAKHVIHLAEAVESMILLTQSITSAIAPEEDTTPSLAAKQLQESLQYRLSLFRSTQLKTSSLQKRIDNAINLSFNLVTQQDSLLMIQDSQTIRIIALITMIFLPTTGVATVAGSQLLVTKWEEGKWDIMATPLFWMTWWIAIPMTVGIVSFALVLHYWTHKGRVRWERFRIQRREKGSCGEKG